MTARRISRTVLRNCKLYVTSTLFENAGDSVITTMKNVVSTVSLDTYTRKHMIFKGQFKASFPNTDQPDEFTSAGDVAPTRDSYTIVDSTFNIEALEDNSQYYCVIPGYATDKLNWTTTELAVGETYTIRQKSMGFVFGTNYTINGSVANDNEALACENNDAVIVATEACKVVEFRVEGN